MRMMHDHQIRSRPNHLFRIFLLILRPRLAVFPPSMKCEDDGADIRLTFEPLNLLCGPLPVRAAHIRITEPEERQPDAVLFEKADVPTAEVSNPRLIQRLFCIR